MCLAVGPTKGASTPIYAGINSSPKDVSEGKNEHFRLFSLDSTRKGGKVTASKIMEKPRSTLFAIQDKKDAYQRIVRLSRPSGGPQLGAVSTGLAQTAEVTIFDTASTKSINIRGRAEIEEEAEDLDVYQSGKNEFLFAYCTKKKLYFKKFSEAHDGDEIEHVHTIPGPDTAAGPPIMDFRNLRFLNSEFVVALANLEKGRGVVLQIFRLPTAKNPEVRISLQARLPKTVKKATGLAVVDLTPPKTSEDKPDVTQFVVAVVGQDLSVSLLSVEYQRARDISVVSNFVLRRTLFNVHPAAMTGVAFSNFIPPASGTEEKSLLKLATVSVTNTVVTHTIPLKQTKDNKSRFVLDIPPPPKSTSFYVTTFLIVLLISILTQSVLEIQGTTPEVFGVKKHLTPFQQRIFSASPHDVSAESRISFARQSTAASAPSAATTSAESQATTPLNEVIESLVAAKSDVTGGKTEHVIYLREEEGVTDPSIPAGITADLHHEEEHGPHGGKTWEELSEQERHTWVRRFKDLGHSAEDLGVTIMKGVVFGTIGGAIGAAVA